MDAGYLQQVINITNISFSLILPLTILAGIFIIYKRNIFEILGILFLGLIPRERKLWGVVRDKTNFDPIPFAQVRLFKVDESTNSKTPVQQNVADMDGRYRILVEDKHSKYFLEAKASGFEPYYKEINSINTLINSDIVIDDILMQRSNDDYVTFRSKISYLRSKINGILVRLLFVLSILSLPLAIFVTLNNPIIINLIFSFTTIVGVLWNIKVVKGRYRPNPGKILNLKGEPIENVIVELFENNQKIATLRTAAKGVVKFDTAPGTYLIRIASNKKVTGFIPIRINVHGYIDKDVKVDLSTSGESSLLNPFS